MYYVRGRWYDPAERRFASEDPLGLAAGINDYAYGSGDPINATDPSGWRIGQLTTRIAATALTVVWAGSVC